MNLFPFPLIDHEERIGDMFGQKSFKGNDIVLFEVVYLVSLFFIFSAGKFYKVGRFVNIVRIAFNNAVGTVIKEIQEFLVRVINVGLKAVCIVNLAHQRKAFIQGVLDIGFTQRREHHTHPFGRHAKETKVTVDYLP